MNEYLSSLEKFGINLGLERIRFLLEKLDNPHLKFQSIHIAGTNGKGSTAAMIASILREAGYKVGLYTSPHLFDYTERIKVNGEDISRKEFNLGLKGIRKKAKGLTTPPTVFEVLTAVAFWYFAKRKVDYAVIEVGMGGRLDATNVIAPLVSVITNIELEHTKILGKTLAKIAAEKAAIIKPGVPVVTAEWKREPLRVIREVAEKQGSLLIQVSRKQKVKSRKSKIENRKSNLLGPHQAINSACAVVAIRLAGIPVSRGAISRGLRKVKWPARLQIISKKPLIIVDGAHNPAGSRTLAAALRSLYPKQRFTIIFGCQNDKDYLKMLKELKPVTDKLIITRSSHSASRPPTFLLTHSDPSSRISSALKKWDKESPLLITGSLFLAADALKILDAKLRA